MLMIRNRMLQNVLRWAIPFVLLPALVIAGAVIFGERRHLFISFAAAALSVLLFLAGIERKKTGTRRLVLTAIMTALCIAGRFIPLCKPVTAVIMLTAMYLGSEAGFLTGAMAALLSNFYFGQGPWTAFQMLAWGLIGWIAGAMAEPLKRSRALLLCTGLLAGVLYSMIMDVWTVLWYGEGFDLQLYLAKILASLPHLVLYAVSNFLFLFWLAKPFGEKLERIRIKYGV
ncbi:MAG: ECF transporter S component [Oscillospiraceae bacterium]|nr:ECF transporter S component [Oscillospiraceae bacterium]